MRNMARIQVFLEGMDEYRKVVEAFLNCTPFMGYVWVCHTLSRNSLSPTESEPGTHTIHTSGNFKDILEALRAMVLRMCRLLRLM